MTVEVMQQKTWHALDVMAAPNAAEAVEHALNELGSLGTETDQLRKKPGEDIVVTGYFTELPDQQTVEEQFAAALEAFELPTEAIRETNWRTVEDRDWLAEWKKHWKATEVGRFVIAPPWEQVSPTEKIVIRIEPNMAFGTGTHETTQLCLEAIDVNYLPGDSFLDVGTGTGILAIAAAKLATENTKNNSANPVPDSVPSVLSVAKILALDTDADSIKIAGENAMRNGVSDSIEFRHGPLAPDAPAFDFVCANLTLDVILPILPALLEKSRKILVLSGLLRDQENAIAEALKTCGGDSENVIVKSAGEWIAVSVSRPLRS